MDNGKKNDAPDVVLHNSVSEPKNTDTAAELDALNVK